MPVPFVACMALVASLYNLPPRALPAIHEVEGGQTATRHVNTDGSEDLGYMQINTRWIPALARYSGIPAPGLRERLLSRPCFNIAAAGYILRTYLDETRNDVMLAIGNYHSHTRPLNADYQRRVTQSARRLFQTAAK